MFQFETVLELKMALAEKGISKGSSEIYLRDTTGISDHKGQTRRLTPAGLSGKTKRDTPAVQLSLHQDMSEIKDLWLKLDRKSGV